VVNGVLVVAAYFCSNIYTLVSQKEPSPKIHQSVLTSYKGYQLAMEALRRYEPDPEKKTSLRRKVKKAGRNDAVMAGILTTA